MIIEKITETDIVEVDELDETKRGAGGFGSTGVTKEINTVHDLSSNPIIHHEVNGKEDTNGVHERKEDKEDTAGNNI